MLQKLELKKQSRETTTKLKQPPPKKVIKENPVGTQIKCVKKRIYVQFTHGHYAKKSEYPHNFNAALVVV